MINVQLVDDSALVRKLLQEQLEKAPGITISGSARDPIFAMRNMEKQWPDVIILDIEMPRMDGITFLKKIMSERPTPVIICSTLTEKGADTTMQAMAAGAVDIITKPQSELRSFMQESRDRLVHSVKAAAQARMAKVRASSSTGAKLKPTPPEPTEKLTADAVLPAHSDRKVFNTTDRVVAIGTSTGGTQALEKVLTRLPRTAPGIVVVQHMPEQFTAAFAERLNQLSEVTVKEAKTGDRVMPGTVLIANGGKHMLLNRSGAQYTVVIKDGPLVSRHRPSVDVLFRSVANAAGQNSIGIIMTGMGDDGVKGMLEMKTSGADTYAQDEASCVVYGMPKEAVRHGAAMYEVSLENIPELIASFS
ncbi:chemotaxis response regulator protein-glutamate methylesterase [Vibrio sp. JC009]|uniref:protein-glutamate methylesterase/protein-glutamine glutaminase n=1 Tax=Vibrio sp. JC009 TaxID=2912314 RepID=UPI0023B1B1E9|nr:chemotaxis response regulator protein-glutamate methylesterase [Vibrio sp. JC009]WED23404.1 chemotaxis response regulator protein-glutamate methylesterase [Vibrio sp. JC009]